MNAVRAGAESGSVSVRSHEVPEMLSNEEFLLWCRRLGLSQEGQEIVTKIRTSGPARRVGGGRENVSGHYPSRKMGVTIQFESHRSRETRVAVDSSYGNITVRTCRVFLIPKAESIPVARNASLERHATLPGTQTRPGADRVFLQRHSSEGDDEVRQTPVRLCLRCHQAPQSVLRAHYKANGKTVNVKLSPEATPLYRAAAQQYRNLKTLLNQLDKLSKIILRYQAKLAASQRQG
ncbi:MAG: hypothetical protein DMG57_29650 [Acidobacteria bacterium]|nr:MAG: hypothetical protein DMG57_29650 [Acidobacteriota bacterium]